MASPDLAETIAQLAEEVRRLRRLQTRVAYRVEDAADHVGVSRSEMYQMARDGRVRKVPDMGARVVIPHSELERVFGVTDDDTLRSVS